MIYYDLGPEVEAFSTNIGDDVSAMSIVTPMHQAHSTNVAMIPDEMEQTYGVDALVTNVSGIGIGVRTADCVPVLLYDSAKHAVGAIHSGWKGTADNIIACAVSRMGEAYGCNPVDMKAVIGPCIHVEAFEVGDEVYEAFASKGYGAYARRMRIPYDANSVEKWHIDLPAICRSQLMECGVNDIYTSRRCTYRDHGSLYSFRYSQCSDRAHRIITAIRLKKISLS